ncbi:potassium transporter Trk [Agaribacter marinus]|uniref:TrkA family potassium uptake protein n=1 Tax=Virgibacillus salarius TaxID=447199 RepID=A0A941DSI5_9BACI|nr:TrkA family potassium uptake protein [Virgibacillus salarius]MBR7794707.1 TrkA family potassium uptake protein [Virgibacillus salarius]NAZ07427.1 potassium transporter Trk [Agaribacter marinus]
MLKRKQFAVIGLGRFGSNVCKELYQLGHEVLAIDANESIVDSLKEFSSHAAVANATDERMLKSLGLRNFDFAIVAIGEHIQPSILCTLLLKEMGIKQVWVKAQNIQHFKVLEKIGADRIIQPEKEMAMRIAHQLDSEKIIDYIELSKEYSIVELVATKKISNNTLVQLDVRKKYGCTILAVKRRDEVNISPLPNDFIYQGDILVVMGHKNDIKRFENRGM